MKEPSKRTAKIQNIILDLVLVSCFVIFFLEAYSKAAAILKKKFQVLIHIT